jgi:hypothetical protein
MYKYIIANKGQGTINADNPIVAGDLFEVASPAATSAGVAQVQADWAEVNPANIPYINNKPDIPAAYVHSLKAWIDKTTLSGPVVISNLTFDTEGHPTGWSVRSLTAANIGAAHVDHVHTYAQITAKPTLDNYKGFNLKTSGIQRKVIGSLQDIDFVPGANVAISYGANGQVIIEATVSGTGADGNNFPNALSFASGTVTLGRAGLTSLSINLDSRYAYRKTVKEVTTATYTINSTDQLRWLVFTINCLVTVPTGLLIDDLYEGEADAGATVTFQAAVGVTLRNVASVTKTLSPSGVFGIRGRANNNFVLYGTDPV